MDNWTLELRIRFADKWPVDACGVVCRCCSRNRGVCVCFESATVSALNWVDSDLWQMFRQDIYAVCMWRPDRKKQSIKQGQKNKERRTSSCSL